MYRPFSGYPQNVLNWQFHNYWFLHYVPIVFLIPLLLNLEDFNFNPTVVIYFAIFYYYRYVDLYFIDLYLRFMSGVIFPFLFPLIFPTLD